MLYKHWKYTTRKKNERGIVVSFKNYLQTKPNPDDELMLNMFGSFCNFLTPPSPLPQQKKKSLKNQ